MDSEERRTEERGPTEAALRLFAGPGEMRARCRALDWPATLLGPVEHWPPHLRTAVDLLLSGGFAMALHYGPQAVQIYNDAYVRFMGVRHPEALGRPLFSSFPERRVALEPVHARVWAGETVVARDEQLAIRHEGELVDCALTSAYSPVRDEEGLVAGVLVAVLETTPGASADTTRGDSATRF